MTSLRELLEAKRRRTARLPVLVGDAASAAERVGAAVIVLREHQQTVGDADPTPEQEQEAQRLRDELTQALAEQQNTVVLVELQALPDDEWDAVFGDIEPDADGEIPLDDFRAALLAASCVDPELRDVDWWETQLARPEWSKGDKLAVNNILLGLNLRVPEGAPGKG